MTSDSSRVSSNRSGLLELPMWWYKPLVWATFLLIVYLLREFFLIGFLTFLFCFVIRSCVGPIKRRVGARRVVSGHDDRRLDLLLTTSLFLAGCLLLYGLGRFFVPPVIREAQSLASQVKNTNAADVQNTLLASTIGTLQFKQQFGTTEDPRYQKALNTYLAAGRNGEGLYETFPALHAHLRAEFEANYEQAQVVHLQSTPGLSDDTQFQQWFIGVKAPELFRNKSAYYIAQWEGERTSTQDADGSKPIQPQPDFEAKRNAQIRQKIWSDVKSDPVLLAQLRNEWAKSTSIEKWDSFRKAPAYQAEFKKFYGTRLLDDSEQIPIDFAYYQSLVAAYPSGKQAFLNVVSQHQSDASKSQAHRQFDFESATKLELGQQWWATSPAADWLRAHAADDGPQVLDAVVTRVDQGLGQLARVPIQVVTAMLLSIFMLFEWEGIKSGITGLRNTRVRLVYDEIAPGVVALGKLMGKSFQGQVIISLFNAIFVLIAMWLIGVEYRFVLSLLVFVFSFIPVVGVILSGLPICVVALLQPDGSLWMCFQVIVAIAIAHLIEGMILSPRIIGKIGELHPVLVIVILLVAEKFFGMWGLLLGVPVSIYIIRVVILNSPIPGIYEPSSTPCATAGNE